MPWKETDAMNERIRYALAYESGLYTITELCTLYDISRPTAYKWMKRFDEGGVAALLQEENSFQYMRRKITKSVQNKCLEIRG